MQEKRTNYGLIQIKGGVHKKPRTTLQASKRKKRKIKLD